jgi:hypothetical protein
MDRNDPCIPQTHRQREYTLQMKSNKLTANVRAGRSKIVKG